MKTCLPIFGHYRFDGSNNLNVWDYRNLAAGGKRTEDNVFLNRIGWKVLTGQKKGGGGGSKFCHIQLSSNLAS